MPAKTEKQRRFMGAELERKREGKKTRTYMSEKEPRSSRASQRRRRAAEGPYQDSNLR